MNNFLLNYLNVRVTKLMLLAFSRRPGGFRELREAGRKHFHLSWYLSVPVVTGYGQKTLGGIFPLIELALRGPSLVH